MRNASMRICNPLVESNRPTNASRTSAGTSAAKVLVTGLIRSGVQLIPCREMETLVAGTSLRRSSSYTQLIKIANLLAIYAIFE